MEKTIRRQRLPKTDSIEALASFWDTHDLTDFAEDLEEVGDRVFIRAKGTSLSVDLPPAEAQLLTRIARSKGVKETTVLRQWILERLHGSTRAGEQADEGLQRRRRKAARHS